MARRVFVDTRDADQTTLEQAPDRYSPDVTAAKCWQPQELPRINKLAKDDLANRPLSNVRAADIADYRNRRLRQVSPAPVRRALTIESHPWLNIDPQIPVIPGAPTATGPR